MTPIFEVLTEVFLDTLKLVPFLFLAVFLMEFLEHKAGEKLTGIIRSSGRFSPLLGAGLGLIPQCGFSAGCAQLFNGGFISAGTLLAVFVSTSDEAIPLLAAYSDKYPVLLKLMGIKFCAAVVIGFTADLLWNRSRQEAYFHSIHPAHECELTEADGLRAVLMESIKRTLKILLFVFLFSLATELIIYFIGDKRLASLLLPGVFQPFLAALFGFIPSCASSVLLTELYLDSMISFGSAIAGLCTSAGVGMLILLRGKHSPRIYFFLLGLLYLFSVLLGLLLQALA